jgi:chorismate mutase/prephenate dehydratase
MARKPSSTPRPATVSATLRRGHADTRRQPTLASLRTEIDTLDKTLVAQFNTLVALLNRRADIAARIGQVKEQQGLDVWSPAREEEVLSKALAVNRGPLPPDVLRHIFRELMSGSRALQRPLRVACLGPQYSYSHLAAVAKFGTSVEHVPVDSIAAVFEEVNRRHVQFGIVPLENSTDGRIADTLEMFVRLPGLKIRAEVKLRIHHCLIGRCAWGQIQRVYSKAQALSQCRHWLGKNLPQARLIPVVSTAAAADHASREEYAAAVASRPAAEAYGLKVLAADIEDQPHNTTRFAVIAEQGEQRTGHDKTTLLIRIPNQVGALSKVLQQFEKANINLTMIESFPVTDGPPGLDPAYMFFLDIEGHIDDKSVQGALEAVRKRCERLEVLGSYPRTDCVEN